MSKICAPNTERGGWHWVYIPKVKGMGYGKAIPLWWNSCGWEHPFVYLGYKGNEEFSELFDSLDPEAATEMGWEYRGPCEGMIEG